MWFFPVCLFISFKLFLLKLLPCLKYSSLLPTSLISAHALRVKVLSYVRPFATLWTIPCQALHPWNSPGQNSGVGSHSLLQGPEIRTQVSGIAGRLYHLSHKGLPGAWHFCHLLQLTGPLFTGVRYLLLSLLWCSATNLGTPPMSPDPFPGLELSSTLTAPCAIIFQK